MGGAHLIFAEPFVFHGLLLSPDEADSIPIAGILLALSWVGLRTDSRSIIRYGAAKLALRFDSLARSFEFHHADFKEQADSATLYAPAVRYCDKVQMTTSRCNPFMNIIKEIRRKIYETLQRVEKKPLSSNNDPRIVNISCWNKWARAQLLEPDTAHGMKYLETVRDVFAAANVRRDALY